MTDGNTWLPPTCIAENVYYNRGTVLATEFIRRTHRTSAAAKINHLTPKK